MDARAATLIDRLALQPHPEGGHYRELYRSEKRVVRSVDGAERSALTEIYYLLIAGEVSRWHRVSSDESWRWVEGASLLLFDADLDVPSVERVRLGPLADLPPRAQREGGAPLHVIAAGRWQAARTLGAYTLVTCGVAPGFEVEDFRLLEPGDAEAALLGELAPDGPAS